MKPNELRIGNLVYYNSKVITINEFPETIILLKELEPISLTEEWLLKCGAKKTDKDDSFGGFIIHYPNGNGIRIKNNEWSSQHITVKIEYIHQLQNLYFALTNEELIINK